MSVGGRIRPPTKFRDVQPVYPTLARQARMEGTDILEVLIDPAGNVTDVKALRSVALLDEAAVTAR